MAQQEKNPPTMRETWVWSLGWKDPPEKGKATHSSILAWKIPWMVQSMRLQSQIPLSDFHLPTYSPSAKILLPPTQGNPMGWGVARRQQSPGHQG